MKSKITAVVLAVAMAVAAVAIVASDESNAADPIPKGPVYVAVGEEVKVTFNITEPDTEYYTNDTSWTITGADNYVTATMETDDDSSPYILTVTGKAATNTTQTLNLTYTCVTKIKDTNTDTNSKRVTQTINYTLDVNVIGSPLKKSMNVTGTAGSSISSVTVYNEGETGFVYYATGLPKGLQMAPNGVISGTPLNPTTGNEDVRIFATHVESNIVFSETINFTVGQANSFDFTVSSNATTITDKEKYIVVQDTEGVTVNTTVGNSPVNIDHVYIIDADGGQTDARKADTGSYSIPTDGSGEYRIVMVNGNVVKSFSLTVVAIVYDVSTGIGFTPASP